MPAHALPNISMPDMRTSHVVEQRGGRLEDCWYRRGLVQLKS
jgi:hypothetical protein